MNIKNKERIINYLTILFVLLTLILFIPHYKESLKSAAKVTQFKLHLRTIQAAFENYYHEKSTYPLTIRDLDSLRNILSSYIENEEILNFEIESYEATEKNYKLIIKTDNKIGVVTPTNITIKEALSKIK